MNTDTNPLLFRGRTLGEARRAAVEALGPSVQIVATRECRKSGWLGGRDWEVAAMVGESAPAMHDPRMPFAPGVYHDTAPNPEQQEVAALRAELKRELRQIRSALSNTAPSQEMSDELTVLRQLLEDMTPPSAQTTGKKADRISMFLRARAIEGQALTMLQKEMRLAFDKRQTPRETESELLDVFQETIPSVLKVVSSPLAAKRRAVVALVGPTGVGKTTTAAKIAARAVLDQNKSVTLVSCDSFRIGAVDQLRRYADLLKATFLTANSAGSLEQIIANASTDIVIIDTAGHGPHSNEGAETYFAHTRKSDPFERHTLLCLPASLRSIDTTRVQKQFSLVKPTALAITKLDETDAPSGLMHGSIACKLPVAILCFGQRVPEDIAPATMGAVIDYLSKASTKPAPNRTSESARVASGRTP